MTLIKKQTLINTVILIVIMGMELSWLYALLSAANKSVSDLLSIPLLLSTLLISAVISKALSYLHWPKPLTTILSWIIWPAAMLLMIKFQLFREAAFTDTAWLTAIPHAFSRIFNSFEPALLVLISTAALWWLGRRLAYMKPDFSSAVTEFQFGMVILITTIFTAYMLDLDQSSSLPVTLIFFSLGLFGISVSHAQGSNWLNSGREGHWTGILLFSIGIILAAGIIISLIFTQDLVQLILDILKWIWGLIDKLMGLIASLFPEQSPPSPPPGMEMPAVPPSEDTEVFRLPEWLTGGARLIWTISVTAFLLFAIWRISSQIFRWMRNRASRGSAEVESLKGAFKIDLLNWLKRLLSRIPGIKFRMPHKAGNRDLPPEIASVRQLYSELLRWGAEKGHSRRKSQTPNEYREELGQLIPENQDGLSFITHQYIHARYGSASPTEEDLSRLKQDWQRIKKSGLKRPNKKGD